MLTDTQIIDLAKRMDVPLEFCNFKDKLQGRTLQYNRTYIINMENEYDEDGLPNEGSHYTAFQANKYPNGKIEKCYFDSFGQPPPQVVEKFLGGGFIPHNKKDIQSLMNSACGWYCLAWAHFINAYPQRSKDLYTDCENFVELFDDLDKSIDHKKNEYILKHFFRSADPEERKNNPVTVFGKGDKDIVTDPNTIVSEDTIHLK